jgi:hypothetical protein
VDLPRKRQAQQQTIGISAHQPHEPLGFSVGADQYVKTVVEREIAMLDAPGAAAERLRGLEDGDRRALFGKRYRRGHAGVATADDGDFHGIKPPVASRQPSAAKLIRQ